MPSLLAWLLSLAIKHWHVVADGALTIFVVCVLLFRGPTVVEVLLVFSLAAHHFKPAVEYALATLLDWAGIPAPEDD